MPSCVKVFARGIHLRRIVTESFEKTSGCLQKAPLLRFGELALDTPKKSGRMEDCRGQFCIVSFPNAFQKEVFVLNALSLCLCCQV